MKRNSVENHIHVKSYIVLFFPLGKKNPPLINCFIHLFIQLFKNQSIKYLLMLFVLNRRTERTSQNKSTPIFQG